MHAVGHLSVSRETLGKLKSYSALIQKWNPAVNLVAKSTIPNIWTRHILDSAQIADLIRPDDRCWLDIGSGGGLPGIVVAIILAEKRPDVAVSLVESDQRKSVFLRTAISELGLSATVLTARIESMPQFGADVVSARALADLTQLLTWSAPHLSPDAQCLFMKGRGFAAEIAKAREKWRFQCEEIPSMTDPEAVILRLQEIQIV